MPEYLFKDKKLQPEETSVASALEDVYPFYRELLGLAGGFRKEWHYYKSSGWLLKIYDSGKALFYFIPFSGTFKVTLTLRESERTALLENSGVLFAQDDLTNAKKYPEGFSMQFIVDDAPSASNCHSFIGELIKLRKGS